MFTTGTYIAKTYLPLLQQIADSLKKIGVEGTLAPCYFAIWRQNSPSGYFAASAKIALSLMLTQTLTV